MKKLLYRTKAIVLFFSLAITSIYAQEVKKVIGTVGGEKLGDDGMVICVLGTQACWPVQIDTTMTVEYNGKVTKLVDLPFALYLETDIDVGTNRIKTIQVDESKTVICFAERNIDHEEKLTRLLNEIHGVEDFKFYQESNQVLIEYNPKLITYSALEGKVKNAGFNLE